LVYLLGEPDIMPRSITASSKADLLMAKVPADRCERYRRFEAIDNAFKAGDLEALRNALGGSPGWADEPMPHELGLGHPLEYAIYWSPVAFIETLIQAGSNPNYHDPAGFPSIIAALSTERPERLQIVRILLESGADPNQHGINDWTPLHWAAGHRDLEAIKLLLASGADPSLRTRIDDCSTPVEDAERVEFREGLALLKSR
jgi:uncharacterized protein